MSLHASQNLRLPEGSRTKGQVLTAVKGQLAWVSPCLGSDFTTYTKCKSASGGHFSGQWAPAVRGWWEHKATAGRTARPQQGGPQGLSRENGRFLCQGAALHLSRLAGGAVLTHLGTLHLPLAKPPGSAHSHGLPGSAHIFLQFSGPSLSPGPVGLTETHCPESKTLSF